MSPGPCIIVGWCMLPPGCLRPGMWRAQRPAAGQNGPAGAFVGCLTDDPHFTEPGGSGQVQGGSQHGLCVPLPPLGGADAVANVAGILKKANVGVAKAEDAHDLARLILTKIDVGHGFGSLFGVVLQNFEPDVKGDPVIIQPVAAMNHAFSGGVELLLHGKDLGFQRL